MSSVDIPRSLGRVLDLLEIVVDADTGCTLTEAANIADLTPTTALRYLRALELRGYLDRDEDGLFSPGSTLHRLAANVREGGPLERLITTAQPHLEHLAAQVGESSYLAIADRRNATYVACAESSRTIRHVGWVGQSVPLEGTAIGAALAMPGVEAMRTGSVEPDITAISLGFGPFGSVRAAISIVGPTHRVDDRSRVDAVNALRMTVQALEADLGLEHSSERSAS